MTFPEADGGVRAALSSYLDASHGGARGWVRDALVAMAGFLPGLPGMAARSAWWRLWIDGEGLFAAERGVRILGASYLTIHGGVYLDRDVYLHGRPGGLTIGAGTRVMRGATLHVYNFRDLPHAGIKIGRRCVIGIGAVITGQGGVVIGDDVIIAPGVMILPVDHLHSDPAAPIREQGIAGRPIEIGRGAWLGAGSIVLEGVTVGENAVVGAGSVVTGDVAARATVAGNPARPIKADGDRGPA